MNTATVANQPGGTQARPALEAVPAFSELVEITEDKPKTKPVIYVLLLLILGVAGFSAYSIFVLEQNPLDKVATWMAGGDGEEAADNNAAVPPPAEMSKPASKPKAAPKVAAAPAAKPAEAPPKPVEGNPYWALPNKNLGSKAHLARPWTPEEEETLRAGLGHRYVYQHFKTVQDVRQKRLQGSDVLLWDALQDKKLWTRMQAAVGLAEFSIDVSTHDLETALGKARSELVAHFFERFVRRPTPAQAYITRQAVRLLDERGRLVALRAIARSKDAMRDLYLVAATQDPAERIQRWAHQTLDRRNFPQTEFDKLLATVQSGVVTDAGLLPEAKKAKGAAPAKATSRVKAGKGDDPNGDIATEDDIDKQIEEMSKDDAGDVEFYETPGVKAVNDKTDEDTFD